MPTLNDWGVYNPNAFAAPEDRHLLLVGVVAGHPRKADGIRLQTSPIVSAAGRVARTASGTEYHLLEACEEYLEYLAREGHPFDPEDPLKPVIGGQG